MKNKTNIERGAGQRRNQVPRQRVFITRQGNASGTAAQTQRIAMQEAA